MSLGPSGREQSFTETRVFRISMGVFFTLLAALFAVLPVVGGADAASPSQSAMFLSWLVSLGFSALMLLYGLYFLGNKNQRIAASLRPLRIFVLAALAWKCHQDAYWITAAVVVSAGLGIEYLLARQSRLPKLGIEVSDWGIKIPFADGQVDEVSWAELTKIEIHTNNKGPQFEDLFLVFYGHARGCVIPQSAPQFQVAMDRIERMSGYDPKAVISAMSSTADAKFLIWSRN